MSGNLLKKLFGLFIIRDCDRGTYLYKEKEESNKIFVIMEGEFLL